ncbi:MAG: hypothetical protein JWO96_156 [Candidatus Saccharibacteria bacterium]|nr:hypothetical protein [Candidatus Saccharibacteria bacterium]
MTDQNTAVKPVAQPNRSGFKKLYAAVIVLILLVIAGGAYYWHMQGVKKPQKYTYSKLDTYTAASTPPGSGISFSKPIEAVKVSTDTPGETDVIHSLKGAYAVFIAAASTPLIPSDHDIASKTLADPTSSYKEVAMKQFVSDHVIAGNSVSYGKVEQFTSGTIKDNAWQMSVEGANPKQNTKFQGRVVYALGKAGFYQFLVLAKDYNWSKNITVWNQVFESLKIDQ